MNEWLICGSGPTLDDADFSCLPANRIAVNASISVVPDCDLVACIDSLHERGDVQKLINGYTRIVTPFTLEVAEMKGYSIDNYRLVPKCKSSTCAAVMYAMQYGADRIIMYGIGGKGYSRQLDRYWNSSNAEQLQMGYDDAREEWTAYAIKSGVELDIR